MYCFKSQIVHNTYRTSSVQIPGVQIVIQKTGPTKLESEYSCQETEAKESLHDDTSGPKSTEHKQEPFWLPQTTATRRYSSIFSKLFVSLDISVQIPYLVKWSSKSAGI